MRVVCRCGPHGCSLRADPVLVGRGIRFGGESLIHWASPVELREDVRSNEDRSVHDSCYELVLFSAAASGCFAFFFRGALLGGETAEGAWDGAVAGAPGFAAGVAGLGGGAGALGFASAVGDAAFAGAGAAEGSWVGAAAGAAGFAGADSLVAGALGFCA